MNLNSYKESKTRGLVKYLICNISGHNRRTCRGIVGSNVCLPGARMNDGKEKVKVGSAQLLSGQGSSKFLVKP